MRKGHSARRPGGVRLGVRTLCLYRTGWLVYGGTDPAHMRVYGTTVPRGGKLARWGLFTVALCRGSIWAWQPPEFGKSSFLSVQAKHTDTCKRSLCMWLWHSGGCGAGGMKPLCGTLHTRNGV